MVSISKYDLILKAAEISYYNSRHSLNPDTVILDTLWLFKHFIEYLFEDVSVWWTNSCILIYIYDKGDIKIWYHLTNDTYKNFIDLVKEFIKYIEVLDNE